MWVGQFGQAKEPEPEADKPSVDEFRERLKETSHITPDLHSQLESLFDCIWDNEQEQDFQRRIDNAALIEELKEKKRGKK